MSSSLLIKSMDGAVIGYALASGAVLSIRAGGRGEAALARISDGRNERTVALACDGREHSYPWEEERRIAWVRIEQEGTVLACAGPAPVMEQERTGAEEKKSEETCKNSVRKNVCLQSEEWKERKAPERRWPPPPCWPSARYFHGEWKEENG